MNTELNVPSPAATVLLVRDAGTLEVLMIRRNAAMAFGASAWVFPGGKVAAADRAPEWDARSNGDFSADERALRVAAARETFEESGLLLATRACDGASADLEDCRRLDGLRGAVEAEPSLFHHVLEKAGLTLALDALAPFAHWITPAFEPRRYDTRFYLAVAPASQIARHDGREAVDHVWIEPTALLEQRRAGEAKLMFPTRLNLEMLARAHNAREAEKQARARTVVTVEPQLVERDGVRLLRIPQEAGYSVVEETFDRVMS